MTNQVTNINQQTQIAQVSDEELLQVLNDTIYPGAKRESVMMVLNYCAAAGLDPLKKPVHIVPMNVKNALTGAYEWRDVVMPGINSYRVDAARSGSFAGVSEPVFGDMIEESFEGVTIKFPEYCTIKVYRQLKTGEIVEFVATEYWIENYATKSAKSCQPNKMWMKRPRGQLRKCAEAQALRMAFPEVVSGQNTAEEMEGKIIDGDFERETISEKLNSAEAPKNESENPKNNELPALLDTVEGVTTLQELVAIRAELEMLTGDALAQAKVAYNEKAKELKEGVKNENKKN